MISPFHFSLAFSARVGFPAALALSLFVAAFSARAESFPEPYVSVRPARPTTLPPAPMFSDDETSGRALTPREQRREELDNAPRTEPDSSPSWQGRYTLGPGDTLNFSIFNRPDLSRSSVAIAPDGTISYLQATNVQARGKSIPELRTALERKLAEFHKDPKVIVTPGSLGSKRYTIIGRVREPGSYTLDRPTTVLEGIASAQGIEVGSVSGSAFELADLDRSFVARHGQKLDIDIASLYQRGNLEENAYLQPNDYIYVASALKNEFYVLGAVNNPGRFKITTDTTVTRAINQAGSFNSQAFKMNVLIVRGSIHKPETFVVNVKDILEGRAPDVRIQNRDLVFVHKRPFQIAEKALDSAIFTFVQTVTAEVVNDGFNDVSIPAQ
ncbi:MAG: polysaccharide biosynthesis/export family protein [Akkermansiaceae bacterium]|nr:polysaccharide biosynthesis/export family protein [Akkermansiaceae bacterium]